MNILIYLMWYFHGIIGFLIILPWNSWNTLIDRWFYEPSSFPNSPTDIFRASMHAHPIRPSPAEIPRLAATVHIQKKALLQLVLRKTTNWTASFTRVLCQNPHTGEINGEKKKTNPKLTWGKIKVKSWVYGNTKLHISSYIIFIWWKKTTNISWIAVTLAPEWPFGTLPEGIWRLC